MSHGVGSKGKKPKKSFKKDLLKVAGASHANGARKKEQNGPKCYFCHGYRHLKKDCPKRRAWLEKKRIPFNLEHKRNEHFIVLGNGTQVPVVGVGTLRLLLESRHCLDLFDTLYVPTISRNLISMSRLDYDGYALVFDNKGFHLLRSDSFVGFGVLS
ncbi:uncharacterized protein LOC122298959 [Carya illinoinensis]|uniref:uncharacterized protein LOC122298959 n=1 Tax=Carya illinoinensis TaxID=32201 RepID=UPI001C71B229|nr:uncharacterized protein LOC122298959 [Carya illinoinensis]